MSSSGVNTASPVVGLNHLQYGLTWTLTALAIMAVVARCYLRRKLMSKLVIEDWLMIVALALQVTYQVGFTLMCTWGSGRPANTLTAEQNLNINKWSWIFAPPGFLVSIIARVSIAILLVRIFGARYWFKCYMTYFTGLQTLVGVVSVIFLVAQCKPYQGLWNKAAIEYYWDKRIYQYTALTLQFLFVISDITYALFPVMIIWRLQMPFSQKAGLLAVMAMSLVTMTAALAKITVSLIPMTNSKVLGDPSVQYFTSIINLSSDCEQCLVIIMGCIPTLRLVTKLSMPDLSKLRSTVLSLLSRRRSNSDSQEKDTQASSMLAYGSGKQNGSSFGEPRLAPDLDVADDESFSSTRRALPGHGKSYVITQSPRTHSNTSLNKAEIYMTDSFWATNNSRADHQKV